MADNTSNEENIECSVFDSSDYVTVAIISSSSALLSALCSTTVIGLIFLLKKQSFFIQRLVLYLCLAALVNSLSIVLRLYRLGDEQQSEIEGLCIAAAFIDQTSMWSLFMAFTAITFTLLMAIVFHKSTVRLEWFYIVLIVFFPLTFNWIPFIENTYGRAGAWCWIRNQNYEENCTEHKFGAVLQLALWYVPAYVLLGMLLVAYLVIVFSVVRRKFSQSKKDDVETNKLHEEVWPLLLQPIGVFILNIFPLVNRIYGTLVSDDPIYALWILHAMFSPLQGGYIALAYILDRATLRRLTYNNFRAFFKSSSDVVREYPAVDSVLTDSAGGNNSKQTMGGAGVEDTMKKTAI
jgi:hypothetical protein